MILHVGMPKTGTSSIQEVLARKRPWLRKFGLFYPDRGDTFRHLATQYNPHHSFAAGMTRTQGAGYTFSAAVDYAQEVGAKTLWGESALISSEMMYRHVDGAIAWRDICRLDDYWQRRVTYLQNLSNALRDFELEVVLFLRSADDFARSFVLELNRTGAWDGDESRLRDELPWLLEYDRQVEVLREWVGPVVTVDYDRELANGGSVPAFFAAIGFPVPPGAESLWVNVSAGSTTPSGTSDGI
jgi:hypothetical protein